MPILTLNAKCLLHTAYFILLVLALSGCSAIGSIKPSALQVTSIPEASVFLDGKHLGKTPFYSEQLKAGEYTIKVTVSDATYTDKITLTPGTLTVVNRDLAANFLAQAGENLSLLPGQKGIFIISWPTDADIELDGKYLGKTPYLAQDIKDGDHKVLITKNGYVNREFAIKSSSKSQLVANVTLASQIAKGTGLPAGQAGIKQASPSAQTQAKQVEILATPQGFLKVRKEPNLSSVEVGQVKTGDTLEVIQETEGWVKVKFEGSPSRASEAGKLGWISKTYTREVK